MKMGYLASPTPSQPGTPEQVQLFYHTMILNRKNSMSQALPHAQHKQQAHTMLATRACFCKPPYHEQDNQAPGIVNSTTLCAPAAFWPGHCSHGGLHGQSQRYVERPRQHAARPWASPKASI